MVRYGLPLAAFVLLLLLFGIGLRLDVRSVPSPLIGKPLPAFTLPQLHNPERLVYSGEWEGQVVLLNVWASWCVACREEHPLLIEWARDADFPYPIYGLNYKDDRQLALQWLARLGDPYRYSAYDPAGKAGLDLGVYGVPETYVLDATGIIRYKHIGPVTRADWEHKLLPLLTSLETPPG